LSRWLPFGHYRFLNTGPCTLPAFLAPRQTLPHPCCLLGGGLRFFLRGHSSNMSFLRVGMTPPESGLVHPPPGPKSAFASMEFLLVFLISLKSRFLTTMPIHACGGVSFLGELCRKGDLSPPMAEPKRLIFFQGSQTPGPAIVGCPFTLQPKTLPIPEPVL